MASQPKHNIPKDANVIISIMKDMGIVDYENRVINQLLEFTYRYVTCILEESRVYANHAKKKAIDVEDTKLAISLMSERSFTSPPHRDLLLDIARTKNTLPLPLVKPHCGVRLPPDRYCLLSCNYKLLNAKKPQVNVVHRAGGPGYMGMAGAKAIPKHVSIMRRQGQMTTVARTQSVTIPKPVIKFSPAPVPGSQKLVAKPKFQMAPSGGSVAPSAVKQEQPQADEANGNELKRKREDSGDSFGGSR